MNEEIKTGTLRFPAKENPYMEMALFNCPIELPYDVKSKYWLISGKFSGMKIFSPKRSLNQPKATCVCIHSINQSNQSISICLLFLFCSRVYISRSFKNCSIDFCDCFSTYTFSLEMGGRYWVNSAGEGMGNLRHAICICRDASLWKSKMWRLSFFALPPPPPRISVTNHPLTLTLTLPISGNCLGHYMKSYMRYRPLQFTSMIIFVSDEIGAKMAQKLNYKSTKIRILSKNRIV